MLGWVTREFELPASTTLMAAASPVRRCLTQDIEPVQRSAGDSKPSKKDLAKGACANGTAKEVLASDWRTCSSIAVHCASKAQNTSEVT